MSPDQIVRAWKDADYDASLAAESSVEVPAHPVGPIDIADAALEASGGYDSRTEYVETLGCCQGFTQADRCDFTAGAGGIGYCTWTCITMWMTTKTVCGAM